MCWTVFCEHKQTENSIQENKDLDQSDKIRIWRLQEHYQSTTVAKKKKKGSNQRGIKTCHKYVVSKYLSTATTDEKKANEIYLTYHKYLELFEFERS